MLINLNAIMKKQLKVRNNNNCEANIMLGDKCFSPHSDFAIYNKYILKIVETLILVEVNECLTKYQRLSTCQIKVSSNVQPHSYSYVCYFFKIPSKMKFLHSMILSHYLLAMFIFFVTTETQETTLKLSFLLFIIFFHLKPK